MRSSANFNTKRRKFIVAAAAMGAFGPVILFSEKQAFGEILIPEDPSFSPTRFEPTEGAKGSVEERNSREYERIICERPIVPTLSPDKAL